MKRAARVSKVVILVSRSPERCRRVSEGSQSLKDRDPVVIAAVTLDLFPGLALVTGEISLLGSLGATVKHTDDVVVLLKADVKIVIAAVNFPSDG